MVSVDLSRGSPTSRPQTGTSAQMRDSIRLEIKCTINVIHLNHPQTIPCHPQFMDKIVFHEIGLRGQKGWGLLIEDIQDLIWFFQGSCMDVRVGL